MKEFKKFQFKDTLPFTAFRKCKINANNMTKLKWSMAFCFEIQTLNLILDKKEFK
jgi:hypothetical protein